jgi:hypothetical protein
MDSPQFFIFFNFLFAEKERLQRKAAENGNFSFFWPVGASHLRTQKKLQVLTLTVRMLTKTSAFAPFWVLQPHLLK